MRKLLAAVTLSVLAAIVLVVPAFAGRLWCARDPIVRLNGENVQIWVAIPDEFVPAVNGPVNVKVYTPGSVKQELVFVDRGFNGYGEDVKFSVDTDSFVRPDGSFDVTIRASVPVDKKIAKKLGAAKGGRTIPFQITVITNGELVTYDTGSMEVINGQTMIVEQTNDMTKITFTVHPES